MPKVKSVRSKLPHHPYTFIRSETNLFEEPSYDVSIISSSTSQHYPTTTITDQTSPIDFFIQSNDVQFVDLNETKLYIKAQIVKGDGTKHAQTDVIGTANNFLHTMIQQATVYLNEVLITPSSNHYAYRAFFETLLNYNRDFKKSQAQCGLFFREIDPSNKDVAKDDGFQHRFNITKASSEFELIGRPFCDIFIQPKFLLPAVDIRISFTRSTPQFCLVSAKNATPKIIISEARLIVKKHTLLPSLLTVTLQRMALGTPAAYPMKRVEVKSYSIAKDSLTNVNDSVLTGLLPDRIVIALVSSKAYIGDVTLNPFHFQDFKLSRMEVSVNGDSNSYLPLTIDFESNQYIQMYNNLFEGLGISNDDVGLDITRESFKKQPLMIYNLRHIRDGFAPPRFGTVQIDLKFKAALEESVSVLVYSEHQSVLHIDKSRNVFFKDFNTTEFET